jgi:hypothetical protein
MSNELTTNKVELAAVDTLCQEIKDLDAKARSLALEIGDKGTELALVVFEAGKRIESLRDTTGSSFHHVLREKVGMTFGVAQKYMRVAKIYGCGTPDLPGLKAMMIAAGYEHMATQPNVSELMNGDQDQQEWAEKFSKDESSQALNFAAHWVHDGRRWLNQVVQRHPLDSMERDTCIQLLGVVRPIRDLIWNIEKRLMVLTSSVHEENAQ